MGKDYKKGNNTPQNQNDNKQQSNTFNNGKKNYHFKNKRDWEKEQRQEQIRQLVQNMVNYSFPITDKKETSGKSILGAYVNIARDNFSKTLQFIFGKIGLKVKNSSNYFHILDKMLEAYKKDKEWQANNPGKKKPGAKSQYLLTPEQNEKLRTLLFHHFSVLAPILGSKDNSSITQIKKEIEKDDENKSLTEEKANEIVKQVKSVVKSAHIDDCLSALICLSNALEFCRNMHSHYRAYNNRDNQVKMFQFFNKTAIYLTNTFKASTLICKANAGTNASQYEFITGEYHYKEEKGHKKELSNYYYRMAGQSNIIKANDKIESDNKYNSISNFGLVYLTSLFLSKSDTELMLDSLQVFENSPFKDEFAMEKSVLTSVMAVYRINIPKGKRLKMEDDNIQICLDMLNELQKCPQELYDIITQDGQKSFKREQTEPMRDPETGEYIREKFIKSEEGQKGQQKVISTDGTGNIVYKGKGVYSLLVRKEDRFPYFALRYIDNRNIFPTIRFHLDLGYYRFAFYPKTRIDGTEDTRILQKRINGFGKLVIAENARLDKWCDLFQESEVKKPNETENAEIAKDEEGNIIEIEQLVKANGDTKPFVTDKRASYNFHSNRIGLYWEQNPKLEEEAKTYVPDLSTKVNDKNKTRPDVSVITPLASLSVHDLPALIFYEYLREDNGNMSAEKIIKDKYKDYKKFFKDIAEGTIKTWDDIKGLKKKDIPEKFWPYLDGKMAGTQTDGIINNYMGKDVVDGQNKYHFIGHIQERINYLEKEIKKFNDICLKMVTTDNEYGTDDYKAFRPASLARKMAQSIMEWLPAKCPAKKTMTGVNYGVMSSVLSQFGSDGKDMGSLKTMFMKGGIITSDDAADVKSNYHPFLDDVLNSSIKNMENLYIEYISKELEHIKTLQAELELAEDKRTFIQTKLPFAKLTRKRFVDRDENYYRQLAQRYLTIDNSDNGGSNNCPAIILLPDGLFTEHIFKLLHNNYPDIFTGNPGEGVNNNASYLISTYFEKVSKDESQRFYQSFVWGQKKPDSKYKRHYKFFDFYDDPKLLKENYPGNSNDRKRKKETFESKLSQQEINEKLKNIDRNAILEKVEEYIQLEEAKVENYRRDKDMNQEKLEKVQMRPEKQWYVHSTTKNKDFLIKKDEEVDRLEKKLKKLNQMILNSEQKIVRIKETYADKFISLKNECQHTERAIRRYRIEDIVTFYMVTTYFKELFKDKPQEVEFRLQDVGSKTFVEGSDSDEAFLDKTVSFSRVIPVTFARNENDMFKKNWEKDENIEKITMDCEVFLNRIAIRNYNLALTDLNDERLISFLTHFACIHYLYGAKLDKPLRINYNRLSLEFKRYNQLRSDIFREVHAIEKIIVDHNTNVLNNDRNSQFYIPMKDEDKAKIEKGEKVVRMDEDAKRNSFVNILAFVYDEHNKMSVYTNNIRKSVAHNYYGVLFKELAEENLLVKIMRAYKMPDKLPHELKHFDKEKDLDKKDPHSFADLILLKIKEIRNVVEKELTEKYKRN